MLLQKAQFHQTGDASGRRGFTDMGSIHEELGGKAVMLSGEAENVLLFGL